MEPNQAQVGNADYWYKWLKHEESALGSNPTPQERRKLLQKLRKQTLSDSPLHGNSEVGLPYGVSIDNYNNRKTAFGRYLYSEKYGSTTAKSHYLDSAHFFEGAYKSSGIARKTGTLVLGLGLECVQCFVGALPNAESVLPGFGGSCYSLEDPASNLAGADFGKGLDFNRPIAEQLRSFLSSEVGAYNGSDPSNSPGYQYLPQGDNRTITDAVFEVGWTLGSAFISGLSGQINKTSFWNDPLKSVSHSAGSTVRKVGETVEKIEQGAEKVGNWIGETASKAWDKITFRD
jgi:hypothetical protein